MTTVVLADDQELVRSGFNLILGTVDPPIEVLGQARDGAEAVDLARRLRPDVIVMDVRMPNVDGIEATRRIVTSGLSSRILMLTTFDADHYVYEAFRAGASGFLLKNAPIDQLASAVHAVAAGEMLLSPTLTRRLIERYTSAPVVAPTPLPMLSEREREVLVLIADGSSNAEIAERLVISLGTVKTHVTRILTKLDLRDRVQVVVFAYENGLVRPGSAR